MVLVQRLAPGEEFRRQVFGVVIAVNLLCALILITTAPLVAAFFSEPILVPILRVLSLQFLLLIFETLPRARLEQGLDFRSQSLISLGANWLAGLTTLALASTGWGVWALVWGRLVSTAATTLALNVAAPSLCLPSFSLAMVRRALSFGGIVTLERGAWQLFTDADKVIGGRLWSDATLGLYSVAQDLATMPMHRDRRPDLLDRPARLLPGAGSPGRHALLSAQGHPHHQRAVVPDLHRARGHRAGGGRGPARGQVAGRGPAPADHRPDHAAAHGVDPAAPALWSIGRPGISAGNVLIAALIIPSACLVGAQWGAMGMAMAWLGAYPLVFGITLQRSGGVLGLGVPDFARAMRAPALASLAMAGVVIGTRYLLPEHAGAVARLLVLVPAGALTYLAALLGLERGALRETAQLVGR